MKKDDNERTERQGLIDSSEPDNCYSAGGNASMASSVITSKDKAQSNMAPAVSELRSSSTIKTPKREWRAVHIYETIINGAMRAKLAGSSDGHDLSFGADD
jgi:hypothetical protein